MSSTSASPTRVSLSYATAYGVSFEDFVERAVRQGFSDVQFIPDQEPNLYSTFDARRIDALLCLRSKHGLQYRVHNVFYDINLLSLVPAVREAAFRITKDVMAFAKAILADTVTVHPGYMFPGWRRDPVQATLFWARAKDSVLRLAEMSADLGLNTLIENGSYYVCTSEGSGRRPLHVGVDPDELWRLVDGAGGGLGVCLDVNKALHSGHPLSAFLERLGPSIRELQVSSVRGHEIELRPALIHLHKAGFTGVVVLEGPTGEAVEAGVDIAALLASCNG